MSIRDPFIFKDFNDLDDDAKTVLMRHHYIAIYPNCVAAEQNQNQSFRDWEDNIIKKHNEKVTNVRV